MAAWAGVRVRPFTAGVVSEPQQVQVPGELIRVLTRKRESERERERERERGRDTHTERGRDRETDKQADRQTGRGRGGLPKENMDEKIGTCFQPSYTNTICRNPPALAC